MKKIFTFSMLLICAEMNAQKEPPQLTEVWQPEPRIVTPGKTTANAPSDAIVLFDGSDLSEWQSEDGKPAKWKTDGNLLTVEKGAGIIKTKKSFGDCQLHIEWRSPAEATGDGQNRGNSGIFLMGAYELQILDSYKNRTYSNGQAGSIYKQLPPLVNAVRKPGEWQTYDIIFTAPIFNKDGILKSQAKITVLHNGVLVQNHATIWGATQYIGIATNKPHNTKEPLMLQDHGDPVSFRNIWIREL